MTANDIPVHFFASHPSPLEISRHPLKIQPVTGFEILHHSSVHFEIVTLSPLRSWVTTSPSGSSRTFTSTFEIVAFHGDTVNAGLGVFVTVGRTVGTTVTVGEGATADIHGGATHANISANTTKDTANNCWHFISALTFCWLCWLFVCGGNANSLIPYRFVEYCQHNRLALLALSRHDLCQPALFQCQQWR